LQVVGQGTAANKVLVLDKLGYHACDAEVEGRDIEGRQKLSTLMSHADEHMKSKAKKLHDVLQKAVCDRLLDCKLVCSSALFSITYD
jgi:hypothetical protein